MLNCLRGALLVCCPLVGVGVCFAQQDVPLPDTTKAWLDANTVKVATLDMNAPHDDLMPLKPVLQNVRIVLLGEQSHSDGATFQAKVRLVRFLHEQLGFNVLAFEAGLFESDLANDLMVEGNDVNSVIYSFQQGVWCVNEVTPLIAYIADTKRTKSPMWLAGFDNQKTGRSGSARVPALLKFVGDTIPISPRDRALLLAFGGLDCLAYHPDASAHQDMAPALERLRTGYDLARTALERRSGVETTAFYSHVLDNLRAYEKQMRAYQGDGATASGNIRDRQMADNVRWLAETCYPREKVICWAATRHIMHGSQTITKKNGECPFTGIDVMGDAVKEHFGDEAYAVGFAAHHGRWGSPAYDKYGAVPPVASDSINGILHRYGQPYLFANLRVPGPFETPLDCTVLGYSFLRADWTKVLDGIFFTDEMTPATAMK